MGFGGAKHESEISNKKFLNRRRQIKIADLLVAKISAYIDPPYFICGIKNM